MSKIGKTFRGTKGRYKIVKRLSTQGAMGLVFIAETTSKPKTEVVIKFALEDLEGSEDRLRREVGLLRAFQKTKPKNVVAYIDESDESVEELFLVMEYLKGQTLKEKIGSKRLDTETVIRFSKDIAEALGDVHGLYTIHRDLKPENLIVTRQNGEEHCVLVDFGIGKLITDDSPTQQIGSRPWSCKHNFWKPSRVDVDCDIYALGRVMFYMATGLWPQFYEYPEGDAKFGNMWDKAIKYGADAELSDLIDDVISYPAHKIQTAGEVIQRLEMIRPSAYQQQKVQARKYSPPRQQQLPKGPHIILGGERWPKVGNLGDYVEIGRSHNCPDPDEDCSRGVVYDGMDGFDYPHNPDIPIPLSGSPQKNVAAYHHIRIWKDKKDGQWYVKDLDTTNYSAILKNNNWEPLNDFQTRKGKTIMLDENFTKLAIGYTSKKETGIEFSFYKQ